MFGYLYYRFYSLFHSLGIRLYRRWLAVISLAVVTGIQALSIDTLLNYFLGTPEFFTSYQILLTFIGLMFLLGYVYLMRSEPHFKIMSRYRMETRKSARKGWIILGLYILITLILFFAGGELTLSEV